MHIKNCLRDYIILLKRSSDPLNLRYSLHWCCVVGCRGTWELFRRQRPIIINYLTPNMGGVCHIVRRVCVSARRRTVLHELW